MNLIVETDLGRDADDFFALCYLFSCGVNIRAITISPGDKDQVSVAKFILNRLGLNIPVGSAKPARDKSSVGGVHVHLLKKYNWPERMEADGFGDEIISSTYKSYPDSELFCIGPLHNVGGFLKNNPDAKINKATLQGGFAGYHLHEPKIRLEKFNNLVTCPTFNLGGHLDSGKRFVETNQISSKFFVGKNVCHTIIYDPESLIKHKQVAESKRNNPPMELFLETMQLFFDKGAPHKMFHDPTAAVCMLHPEIGTWIDGTVYYEKGKWGTSLGGPHRVLVDIDRVRLRNHIFSGT